MAVQIAKIEHGFFNVDTYAIGKILEKVGDNPVAIVTVSGPLQKGKSKIINNLLRSLTARKTGDECSFRELEIPEILWKNSADQDNEILMWPEPFLANHGGSAILLMSVHGNLDGTITTMENALIFTFGCLLSSVMLYHIKDGLSDPMLQFLHMTIVSAKAISYQCDGCRSFAKLIFLINGWPYSGDFSYGYHDDHYQPSSRNFKMEKLSDLTGIMPENSRAREIILFNFNSVSCYLADKFGDDEKIEDEGPLASLEGWISLEGYDSIKKMVNSGKVTGTELNNYVQDWAEAFSKSEIPTFLTKIKDPGGLPIATALSLTLSFFNNEMLNADRSMDRYHEIKAHTKKKAIAMFERLTMTVPQEILQKYQNVLHDELQESINIIEKQRPPPASPPQGPRRPRRREAQRETEDAPYEFDNRTVLIMFAVLIVFLMVCLFFIFLMRSAYY